MNSAQQQGPRYRQLALWRDASRLLVAVESAGCQLARHHKYTLGAELCRQAMGICRCVARAARCTYAMRRSRHVEQCVWGVEDLKMTLQLAKEVEGFASFAQFRGLAELSFATQSTLALRCLSPYSGVGRQAWETSPRAWVIEFKLLLGLPNASLCCCGPYHPKRVI